MPPMNAWSFLWGLIGLVLAIIVIVILLRALGVAV